MPDEAVEALDRYCRALWTWNEKLNLTRHTDYEKFVTRDVVDSLALEPFLDSGAAVLDVGTGGGVPGVVLAIVRPDLDVALCDSVAKKAKAAEAIVAEIGLPIQVFHAPAQEVVAQQHFDVLVARAVAPLSKLLRWFAPHWDAFDRLLVIKGPAWVEERAAAREAGLLRKVDLRKLASYPLPGTNSESVVLSLRASAADSRNRARPDCPCACASRRSIGPRRRKPRSLAPLIICRAYPIALVPPGQSPYTGGLSHRHPRRPEAAACQPRPHQTHRGGRPTHGRERMLCPLTCWMPKAREETAQWPI